MVSADDDSMETAVLKQPIASISEALEPTPPKARLVRMSETPEGAAREFPLSERSQVLGRDPANAIQVESQGISRVHARIYADSGAWVVEDLRSRNGVFVNKARITAPTRLYHGDVLRVSQVTLGVVFDEPGEERPAGRERLAAAAARAGDGPVPARDHALSLERTTLELDSARIKAGILATVGKAAADPDGTLGGDTDDLEEIDLVDIEARLLPHAESIAETLVRRAVEGEPTALKLAVERLWPTSSAAAPAPGDDSVLGRTQGIARAFEAGTLSRSQAETMLRQLLRQTRDDR